ncbi:MAG: hypothetical protein RSD64_04785, partial [Christensenellaceae bacterium]
IEMVEEEVYYPPDTGAMIFWLINRLPDDWKNKRENTLAGEDGTKVQVTFGVPRPTEDEKCKSK